jgi:hypothetical protein
MGGRAPIWLSFLSPRASLNVIFRPAHGSELHPYLAHDRLGPCLALTGRPWQNCLSSRTFYISCHGLDTGLLTGACSCRNTHTVVLHLVSGSVTGFVVAVASSSVRSIRVPLFFLKAFTISSVSCWAMCPTPCFLSSEMVAILTAFSRVRFSAVTHFLSTSCLPMLATNCCRISASNFLNWQFLVSCLGRMANSFAVSLSCLKAHRITITSVNTTVFVYTNSATASFVSRRTCRSCPLSCSLTLIVSTWSSGLWVGGLRADQINK